MGKRSWRGLIGLWGLTAGAALMLGAAPPRAMAGGLEEKPPPPVTVGEPRPVIRLDLPANPVEPGKAKEEAPEKAPAEAPKKEWKILAPKHVVPDRTMLFVSVADAKRALQAYQRTALAGLLGEDEVQRVLGDVLRRLRAAYVEGDGTLAPAESRRRAGELDLALRILDLMRGQAALAVEAPEAKERAVGGSGIPRFLLVMAMGDEACQAEIRSAVEAFAGQQLVDPRFRDEVNKLGPYEARQIRCDELDAFCGWSFVENLFLYGWGKGLVQDAVQAYLNQKGTLALSPGYETAFSRVGADALVYVQFDGTQLLSKMMAGEPMLERSLKPVMEGFGENRPQLAVGMQVAGEGKQAAIKEKWLLRLTKAAQPQVMGPCRNAARYLASPDSLLYSSQQGNLGDMLKWALAGQPEAAEPGAEGKALERLAQALKVEKTEDVWKVLAPFRGEMAMVVDYVPGESLQKDWQDTFQVVFAVEVSQTETANAKNILKLLRDATGLPYHEVKFSETDIHYQAGATPDEKSRGIKTRALLTPQPKAPPDVEETMRFFVACAVHEVVAAEPPCTFVLMSDSLKALKKAIQQSRTPRHSLNDQEEFRRLLGSFDEGRHTTSYLALPTLVSALYRQLVPELVNQGVFGPDLLRQLPPDTAVLSHLSPMGWASTVREEGVQTEIISPAGNLPLLGLVGALAWPAYTARQQQKVSEEVTENLRKIGLGLHLYAAAFDRFPARLSDLHPEFVSDLRVFASPFDRGAVKTTPDVDDWRKTNLVYMPGHSFQDLSQDLLVFEVRPSMVTLTEDQGYRSLHQALQLDNKVLAVPLLRLKRLVGNQPGILTPAGEGTR